MSRRKLIINMKLSAIKSKRVFLPAILILVLLLSGLGLFLYSKNVSTINLNVFNKSNESDPNVEAERLIKSIGEKFLLPDEIPTVATVSDKNQLSDQVFFKNAENGDRVLIYKTAGIAILYRPAIEKIINVGPVTLDEGQIEANAESEVNEALSSVEVLILNGTNTVGITQGAASRISGLEYVNIADRSDAREKPYTKSIVVYLSDAVRGQANAIAASFSAQVQPELPEGEASTSADIVVILGDDYTTN